MVLVICMQTKLEILHEALDRTKKMQTPLLHPKSEAKVIVSRSCRLKSKSLRAVVGEDVNEVVCLFKTKSKASQDRRR